MHNETPYMFILGAADPESSTIEQILIERNIPYYYASNGIYRVSPSTAYEASTIRYGSHSFKNNVRFEDYTGVFVECDVPHLRGQFARTLVIDHHRPGDPGFGKPPTEFWLGSSLGQTCKLLDIEPTPYLEIIAAADHCLAAAYRNECPGINPAEVLKWRVSHRAKFKGISEMELMQKMLDASVEITNARTVTIANEVVADFTYYQCPEEHSEGSLIANIPVIYREYEKKKQMYKFKLTGARRETIDHWMKYVAPIKLGLVDIYGDPWRGFAGGYVPNVQD